MKKLYILLSPFWLFTSYFVLYISCFSFAQSSNKINYQAVARNASGTPLAIATVTVSLDIHRGGTGGPVSMSETHITSTNQFGLFNLLIGSVNTAAFDTLHWGRMDYFLQVTVNGSSMGTTQFVSVPYALHSKTADSLTGGSVSVPWTKSGSKVILSTVLDSVGIGTSAPEAKLHVESTGSEGAGIFRISDPANANNALVVSTNGLANAGLFQITNASNATDVLYAGTNGGGRAGVFEINNVTNMYPAVWAQTNSNDNSAVAIQGSNTGLGTAGFFEITNAANTENALNVISNGGGNSFVGYNSGTGRSGLFQINNAANSSDALLATTNGTGKAGNFSISNAGNSANAVTAGTNGTGTTIYGVNTGGGSAGIFEIASGTNSSNALVASTNGTARAGHFQITNSSSAASALFATTGGTGLAGEFAGKVKTAELRINDGHIKSSITVNAAPTVSLVSGTLGSPTLAGGSTDTKGTIQTTGSLAAGGTASLKITFGQFYNSAPVVVVTAAGAATGIEMINCAVASSSTGDAIIKIFHTGTGGVNNPSFNYVVIE